MSAYKKPPYIITLTRRDILGDSQNFAKLQLKHFVSALIDHMTYNK